MLGENEAKQIVTLWGLLDAEKGTIKNELDEIAKYVTPNKPMVTTRNSPGVRILDRYDSTAIQANDLLSSTMQGTLTPSTDIWSEFHIRDEETDRLKDTREWFEDSAKRLHKALNASNFSTKVHEGYKDLGAPGTTAVLSEETPKDEFGKFTGLRFTTFSIREYVFTEGPDGIPNAIYRKMRMTPTQIKTKLENLPGFKGLGPKISEKLKSERPEDQNTKVDVIHAIFERETVPGKDTADNMPYASVYIAVDDKFVMSEGGFEEFPVAIARWSKQADDNGWGRSPAWIALSEIKTINRVKKLALKGLAKDISPPLLIPHKGLIGSLNTGPNKLNYYDPDLGGGRAKPEYLTSGINWSVEQFKEEELREQINKAYFVDKLELPNNKEMTATESSIRFEMLQRLLGPTFHRLTDELFDPLISRVFQIMLRAGAFAPMPEAMQSSIRSGKDAQLDIVYTGPLARAQRRGEVDAIHSTYQSAATIVEVTQDSSVLDNLDGDTAIRMIMEQNGTPMRMQRSVDEVTELRNRKAEALEQQNQQAELAQAIELESAANAQAA